MADTLESEFIFKFHSLPGITIKERQQKLSLLLNETQRSLELTCRKIDLSRLCPSTPLEECFKVKALIHFKCESALWDVLRSENPQLINQVLKHSSLFLKNACENITPEYLTTQIFPNISYSTKEKLLNKLSYHLIDTAKSDNYFEAIKVKYGLYLASKLLPSCSCDLIMKHIEFYKAEVTAKQLLIIIKKRPSLTESILEKLHQQNAKLALGEKYQIVFKYLAKNDVELFIKLYLIYSPCIRLGTKETDRFIKNCDGLRAFENGKICEILKDKQIANSFGNDFKDFYYKTFPKCMTTLRDNLDTTLELLTGLRRNSEKLNMFATTFKRIYGNEIWEYAEFKIPKLIEWMDPNDREVFLQNHNRPTDIWEETWISYYKCEKAVPSLKEKIPLLSSIKRRTRCIIALLKTCKINNDNSALLDVLKYINTKHRNEHFTVVKDILTTLNNDFKAKTFTEDHWVEINQCVQYFMLNNNNNYYYYCRQLSEKYIFYRLSQNLNITEYLEKWAKQYPDQYNICLQNSKFEKICLVYFEDLVPLGCKNERVDRGYLRYLSCIRQFNKRHPKNKIILSMKDEYFKYVKTLLKDDDYSYMAELVASDLIVQNLMQAEDMDILKRFLNANYYLSEHTTVITWLYKTHPVILLKHFDTILLKTDNRTIDFKLLLKRFGTKYSHIKMQDIVSKLCYEIIKDENSDIRKFKNAIVALSVLSTPQEFLAFSLSYSPSELSPNTETSVKQNFFKRQQAVVKAFSNLNPLSQTWENILQFCKGDYLKFARGSFVLTSVHTVENKLPQMFDMLKDRSVSVRKHALILSSKFLSIPQAYNMLSEFMQKEKNASILRVVFKAAFRMFLQNANDYSWKLLTQCTELVNITSNEETLDLLTNCQRVPLHYFREYMKFTWVLLDKEGICNKTIEDAKSSLLNLVTAINISTLSDEFCTSIIEHSLFKCEQLTDLQKTIQSFTCKYLIYGGGNQEERLKYVFDLLKKFQAKSTNSITIMATQSKLVYNFITLLCRDVMDKRCSNKVFFPQFLSMWEDTLKPFEACDEFIYLQLTSIYLISIENTLSITQIGEKISRLCELLHSQNCLDVRRFSTLLKEFLEHFYSLTFIGKSDENQILLIETIIRNRTSYVCLEVGLTLIPDSSSISSIIKQKYDSILNVLLKEPNNLLQVAFQSYLKNRTDSDISSNSSRNF